MKHFDIHVAFCLDEAETLAKTFEIIIEADILLTPAQQEIYKFFKNIVRNYETKDS